MKNVVSAAPTQSRIPTLTASPTNHRPAYRSALVLVRLPDGSLSDMQGYRNYDRQQLTGHAHH